MIEQKRAALAAQDATLQKEYRESLAPAEPPAKVSPGDWVWNKGTQKYEQPIPAEPAEPPQTMKPGEYLYNPETKKYSQPIPPEPPKPEWKWEQTGTNINGNPIHGWVQPPSAPGTAQPSAAAPSAAPAAPGPAPAVTGAPAPAATPTVESVRPAHSSGQDKGADWRRSSRHAAA